MKKVKESAKRVWRKTTVYYSFSVNALLEHSKKKELQ